MQKKLVLKILVITGLILFLLVPLAMIDGVIMERSGYRYQVEQDIADTWTGNQQIIGPVLSMPYEIKYEEKLWDKEKEQYQIKEKTRWETTHFIPQNLSIVADIATEKRSRGIYTVPVYTGRFTIDGDFSSRSLEKFRKAMRGFTQWGAPRFSLAIQDVRGIGANPKLLWAGESVSFDPGSSIPNLAEGIHAILPAPQADGQLRFALELELRGSRSLQIAPTSKDTATLLRSSWPHPKFDGRFLPVEREVTPEGFEASWQTSSFSTSVEQHLNACLAGDCSSLRATSFGVQFIETVDIYQKITRATKYGILFILLTFVAFFLTETLINTPLHPVQYVLVGFALCIFYLLLISLSEHFGFAIAYGIATASCALLIGIYLTGALGKATQGFGYATGISLLYAMLFAILRSEDHSMLMGTLLLFAMLAAVMLMTRRVNWYEIGEEIETRLPTQRMREGDASQEPAQ